jgi:xylulokinase
MLGIDLGTSSVKAIVLDERGQELGLGKAGYELTSPRPGWAESDPAAWWEATVAAVRATLTQAQGARVSAIGLSGQMHGVVLSGEDRQPLRPAMLWPDTRAGEELALYRDLPAEMLRRLANPLAPGMAGPLLCWLARYEPAIYQQARWALQPKDWLRLQLTGIDSSAEIAVTDPSDASATLLYDLFADDWAEDVISALGLRRTLFPPILPSSSLAGTLSAEAASTLGLPSGLPVVTGASDTAAAMLGAGLLSPGQAQLTLGTGAQIVRLLPRSADHANMHAGKRTHLYRAADDRYWYEMAAVQNAGLALDWVRRVFNANWDELYASASVAFHADGLTFLPTLVPERFHDAAAYAGGAFTGLHLSHSRENLLHAALKGVASGIREALDLLDEDDKTTPLRLVGGGSVYPAWRQLLVDVLGRELLAVDTTNASVRGAALLAGIATGVWADVDATKLVVPRTDVVVGL